MKYPLFNLPFWARSPSYHRNLGRRLGEPFRRSDFIADDGVYIPLDPPRWRWHRDPAVIGGLIGLALVVAAFAMWGGQ